MLVYSTHPRTTVNGTNVAMTRVSTFGTGFTGWSSIWKGIFASRCVERLNFFADVIYYVFPFIPGDKRFPGDGTFSTVINRPVTAVTVTSQSVLVTRTRAFGVAVTDKFGCLLREPVVTWSTSDPTVATVAGNGFVTGMSTGAVTISAMAGGVTGSATISVGPAPTLTAINISNPSPLTLEPRTMQQLTVMGTWSDGVVENVTSGARGTTYSSSNAASVPVHATGDVEANSGPATAVITATNSGQTDSVTVNVLAPFVNLAITPDPAVLSPTSTTTQMSVTGVRSDGTRTPLTTGVGLTAENSGIASVAPGFNLTFRARGATKLTASYSPPNSPTVFGQSKVCNQPPTAGPFSVVSGSSTSGPTFRREVLSNRHDKVTVVAENDQRIEEFTLDKPAGDEISVHAFGRKFIVVVHIIGGDSVIEVLQGGEYVFQVTPGSGFKNVYIYNATRPLGSEDDRERRVADSSDVREDDDVVVLFSPDGQLVNLRYERAIGATDRNVFYRAFDQDVIEGRDYTAMASGGVYSASLTFTTNRCTGTITWAVDNPPGSSDTSRSVPFEWPHAGAIAGLP
jgi:hypothetical protein